MEWFKIWTTYIPRAKINFMDEKKLKRPSSNLNWLWWSLGAFFSLVFTFQLGVWSAGDSSEGLGKKVGIINIVGPVVSAEPTVKELEKLLFLEAKN